MKIAEPTLVHELPLAIAERDPQRVALTHGSELLTYGELAKQIHAVTAALVSIDIDRGDRVAIYLEKRFENVIALFAAARAGCMFVPVNPLLKPEQVAHILADCSARVLITSSQRLAAIEDALSNNRGALQHVITVDDSCTQSRKVPYVVHTWTEALDARVANGHRVIDSDAAAILYTSGSTGHPKGVVLSHRNIVAGARSVAHYLENTADDILLAVLPLSFDAGFSQLTTGFLVGARIVLLNYVLAKDLINVLSTERVTGLTAVPTLYIQLCRLDWPATITEHLRYLANTGGRMPRETLKRLQAMLPRTKVFLMYGLTEAFRATYLPPDELDRRPDSIGQAIPNTEVLVLREDGTPCATNEPGELVQRGALVSLGYWNDRERTAARFRPLLLRLAGVVTPDIAVFSGDTVRRDEEGFLYFIGRRDEMIKTSGYRVSPTEVEDVLDATELVREAAVFGVPHPELGEAIVAVVVLRPRTVATAEILIKKCARHLPMYMVPLHIELRADALPQNANGKIDRKLLACQFVSLFGGPSI